MNRHVLTHLAVIPAVIALSVSWLVWGGPGPGRRVRHYYEVFGPVRTIEIVAGLVVIGIAASLARALFPAARTGAFATPVRGGARVLRRVPAAISLSVIVGAAVVVRSALTYANHYPKVLGDELVYASLAKGWALHGEPLVRGTRELGYSILYPLVLAPLFRVTSDGATALELGKDMNVILMALTAVPAYVFARRVVSKPWALVVATLSVFAPWTEYAALTMTESLFYPVFVCYAAALVWALERPTWRRQAVMLALLAAVVLVRAQGLTVALGTVAAIVGCGLLEHRLAARLRAFAPTLAVFAACVVLGGLAKAAGVTVPTSSYDAVFGSVSSLVGMIKWGAWSVGSFGLELGVVVIAAFPLALRGLIARDASGAERATGVATSTLALSVLGSVALLSASPYGLGILHSRSLFYLTPLLITCFAHWLEQGLQRPRALSIVSALATIGLVAALSRHLVVHSNAVDLPSAGFFKALDLKAPDVPFRVWTIGLATIGAGTVLFARRSLFPLLAVVVAFAAVSTRFDASDTLSQTQARALSWVDHVTPAGTDVTLVYLGLPATDAPCASVARAQQDDLTIWTEFFNTRVGAVDHIYATNGRDFLASHELMIGDGGLVLDGTRPFRPRFVVIDTRQPLVGTKLARFDLASIGAGFEEGSSLTLWKVDPPLRLYSRAQPLPPRGDGRGC